MLVANFPGLEQHMAEQYYRVTVGSYDLGLDEIHDPAGQQDIKIMPVIAGAGGGVGKILIGVALVAAAIVFAPAAAGFLGLGMAAGGTAFTLGAAASVAIGSIGASLILGGVSQLLTPVPKIPQGSGSDDDPRKTFNFSGIQQTSRQGVPVPCVYGLTLVGSVVISAGTDTVQVTA
jgi:predicted phage tail protein